MNFLTKSILQLKTKEMTSDNFQKHNCGINQGCSSLSHRFKKSPCYQQVSLSGWQESMPYYAKHQAPGLRVMAVPCHVLQEGKKLL